VKTLIQRHHHTRALKHIRLLLTLEASKTFAVLVVGGKLELCYFFSFSISQDKLQRVQTAECRTLCRESLRSSVRIDLKELGSQLPKCLKFQPPGPPPPANCTLQAPWSVSATDLRLDLIGCQLDSVSSIKLSLLTLISRPTPRLLSFALCLEWINGIYNTIHSRHSKHSTHCVECYRLHAAVGTTTPVPSIASTSMVENCHKYAHENKWIKLHKSIFYMSTEWNWINKWPRNLLNKIQNVFINGKQIKTDKTTQIIPWFSRFLRQNNYIYRQFTCPHAPTVTFARWQHQPTEVSGCGQLADDLKVGRRDISMF